MLAVALRRRDAKESVTAIVKHLGVGRSTLYAPSPPTPKPSPPAASPIERSGLRPVR
ncbi:helix-turn-helix domain-containing protein [Streptomyces sp. ICC4]|uniref:helix-turn-helix domain-containing protein n=1 Tax=Streptomyces sp. ICC4 TaxID=2099584 RepID=UPI001EF8F06F|nr:helix-turn-helix domain-containing protein [Streptomyces sp. ICC4]